MTKKFISKLVVILLCAVLILPASLTFPTVKASGGVDAYPGVEFSFKVSDEVINANQAVVITASYGTNSVELFNDGETKKDEKNVIVLSSYTEGVVTARITKAGEYVFTVKTIVEENETAETFTKSVTVHSDVNSLLAPKYKYVSGSQSDLAKLSEYEQQAVDKSYVDSTAEVKQSIFVDETYTVPSVEGLIDLGSFSYSQYKKTVNYSVPGSTSYNTATASGTSNLTFTITKVGTYRFYVLLSIDEIDGKSFNISVNKLKEYDDGFYTVKRASDSERLYVSGNKYFLDEELKQEYKPENEDTDVIKGELIVPIFEFTIVNAGPNVKITSSYQENGYIGLEYKITSVKVSGNEVSSTYALKYRQNDTAEWVDATEEFDDSEKTFTPEKQGYYKLIVTAIDSDGKTKTAETKEIKVVQKFETVDYKTGFNDWISVNYVPFIFLCISGVCLIAIILLLVIKPKQKTTVNKVEEDK